MEGSVTVSDVRRRKQARLTDFWKTEETMEDYVRLGKKRVRVSDRLSELPESLLIQILSLLEMKEAVKTGILSTRWKLLWTKVDTIVYEYVYHRESEEEGNRISFVDHTLMQCTSPRIKQFRLETLFLKDKATHQMLDRWLTFILHKNVEIFELILWEGLEYSLPNCLYRNSLLLDLNIMSTSMSVSSPVSWRLLRSLNFDEVRVDDESFANILLGCPVLENIVLDRFWGIKNLSIMSPSVKKLILRNPRHSDDDFVKVNAPWIQELKLGDGDLDFFIRHFQLVDVSSLKSAQVCFYYNEDWHDDTTDPNGLWWNEMVEGLFKSLCHVAELTICTEILQALAVLKLLGKPYPLLKCKHMTVIVPLWKYDLYGMACLLQNTPYLETLFIRVTKWQSHHVMPYPKENFDMREQEMSLPEGNLMHLEYVKIDYERRLDHSPVIEDGKECLDDELVQYILSITSGLKKLVILSSGGCRGHQMCYKCYTKCGSQLAPLLSFKLLLNMDETLEWELVKTKSAFEFRFSNRKLLPTKE